MTPAAGPTLTRADMAALQLLLSAPATKGELGERLPRVYWRLGRLLGAGLVARRGIRYAISDAGLAALTKAGLHA